MSLLGPSHNGVWVSHWVALVERMLCPGCFYWVSRCRHPPDPATPPPPLLATTCAKGPAALVAPRLFLLWEWLGGCGLG